MGPQQPRPLRVPAERARLHAPGSTLNLDPLAFFPERVASSCQLDQSVEGGLEAGEGKVGDVSAQPTVSFLFKGFHFIVKVVAEVVCKWSPRIFCNSFLMHDEEKIPT